MAIERLETIVSRGYDMHMHVGPDLLPRRYTVAEFVKAERGKLVGAVAKCHAYSTARDVSLIAGTEGDMDVIPAMVMNNAAGWPNPDVVVFQQHLNPDKPLYVWMPTIDAANHLAQIPGDMVVPWDWVRDTPGFLNRKKSDVTPITVFGDSQAPILRPEVEELLSVLAQGPYILGTGHLSAKEAETVARKARSLGVPHVVLTHPHEQAIAMEEKIMRALVTIGVWIEICAIPDIDRSEGDVYPSTEQIAAFINSIGAEHVFLTSDTGQTSNSFPSTVLREYCRLLCGYGISIDAIGQMLIDNPKKILYG